MVSRKSRVESAKISIKELMGNLTELKEDGLIDFIIRLLNCNKVLL